MKQNSKNKIFIFDCEHFYNTSPMPNIKAMKLASYHKQLGDKVVMITSEEFITNNYDIMYIIKEYNSTPFPPSYIFDDNRTKLLGKALSSFDGYFQMPPYVAATRPDYHLYENINKWTNANFVQYFCGFYKINNMQDFHRVGNISRLTIISDEDFWDHDEALILETLEKIKKENNVWFQYPIDLKSILRSKEVMDSFSELNFAKRNRIKFFNNLGNSLENAIKIIDYLRILKTKHRSLSISPPTIAIITKDHWKNSKDAFVDFERCMRIAAYAKMNQISINFKYPKYRLATPVWDYFEFFRLWTSYSFKKCYFSALLKSVSQHFTFKPTYDIILNDVKYWNATRVQMAVHLLTHYTDLMKETGFVTWGNEIDERANFINYEYIKEKENEYNVF